jgi:hypothetical protein
MQMLQALSVSVDSQDPEKLHNEALNSDIRKQGYGGALPDDVHAKQHAKLAGPIICQIGEVFDISRPSYAPSAGQDSLLYCQLTDGRINTHAVALSGAKSPLSTKTLPGTKIVLNKAIIECGLIMLDSGSVTVRPSAHKQQRIAHAKHSSGTGMCTWCRCPISTDHTLFLHRAIGEDAGARRPCGHTRRSMGDAAKVRRREASHEGRGTEHGACLLTL